MKLGQHETFVLDVPLRIAVFGQFTIIVKKYYTALIDSLSKPGIITETLPGN